MRVVMCGGGVIGACTASGKSGGFLALDWCDGSVDRFQDRWLEAAPTDLHACFQNHVERRGCCSPNVAEASRGDDFAQFRFAGLRAQCCANLL